MTGKRSNTSICPLSAVVLAAMVVMALGTGVCAESLESFLLPGVDIRAADLSPGNWCRYLVVDEAEGIRDSVSVYVAVLGRETIGDDEAYWMEFESARVGAPPGDRDVTRVLISSSIKDLSRGDSLYHYVRRIYIKRGTEPVEPADPRDLKRLTLTDPTGGEDWLHTPGVSVSTPMGPLLCDRKELVLEESREVPTGRVKIIQYRKDHFTIWSSPEIPIFGLARCVIDRIRESKTIPSLPGIPETGPRNSRVTTMVQSHGDGAKPLFTIQ